MDAETAAALGADQEFALPGVNPFRPTSPVPPGMFIGRVSELVTLELLLTQACAGEAQHFALIGERGIGKSSLLLYLTQVAAGRIASLEGRSYHFLVVDTDIDAGTTQVGLVKKIELGIKKALEKSEPARDFLNKAWGFVQRLEAGGVRLAKAEGQDSPELLLDEFAYSLGETVTKLTDGSDFFGAQYDGLLVLIDEASLATPALELGTILKLTAERLQRRGCTRAVFGLAGLPELPSILAAGHASAPRAFKWLELGRLSDDDVGSVITKCLERGKEVNGHDTKITDKARDRLVTLSEGYPHFIQQFGYSAFDHDTDNVIDDTDVVDGALKPHGALETIGLHYYHDDFYKRIQEERYRHVLRIMASNLDDWTTRKAIAKEFKGNDSKLTNALHALKSRGIIEAKEDVRGVYRLRQKAFALWIALKGTPPEHFVVSSTPNEGAKGSE